MKKTLAQTTALDTSFPGYRKPFKVQSSSHSVEHQHCEPHLRLENLQTTKGKDI